MNHTHERKQGIQDAITHCISKQASGWQLYPHKCQTTIRKQLHYSTKDTLQLLHDFCTVLLKCARLTSSWNMELHITRPNLYSKHLLDQNSTDNLSIVIHTDLWAKKGYFSYSEVCEGNNVQVSKSNTQILSPCRVFQEVG